MQADYDDRGLTLLAAAIVEQAVDDWRHICNTAFDVSSDTKRHPLQYASSYTSFGALQAFFESDWCDLLCGAVDPERILTQLNAERDVARLRKAPVRGRMGRKARIYEHEGERHTLSEWAALKKINHSTLSNRLKRGWTFKRALTYTKGNRATQ